MGYATVNDFRIWTGLQENELSDTLVQDFLDRADNQIKRDAFVYNREEPISPDTNGYYRPVLKYFADANADGSVTAEDIEVREYNSTLNVTSTVDSSNITAVDSYNNYFTLNNSSYTASNQIRVNYWILNRPNEELIEELKEMSISWAAHEAFKLIKTKRLKSGIVSFNLGKLSVTRTEDEYEGMVDQWRKRYMHLVEWIKPSRYRKMAESRATRKLPYGSRGISGNGVYHIGGGSSIVGNYGYR